MVEELLAAGDEAVRVDAAANLAGAPLDDRLGALLGEAAAPGGGGGKRKILNLGAAWGGLLKPHGTLPSCSGCALKCVGAALFNRPQHSPYPSTEMKGGSTAVLAAATSLR